MTIHKDNGEAHIDFFASASDWEKWLAANHATSDGIWMRIFKKDSRQKTITYAEALDEALCYGWVDGQKKKFDCDSWIQKFTPRRARSMWSKRNIKHVERLTYENRMKPGGFKAFEDAKIDGRLATAYDSPSNSTTPADFLEMLGEYKEAKAFFDSLNKANKYAITWRLQTAKRPGTREKRMITILEMLLKGEKFH